MKILSHRGYWKTENEKNTFESIKKSMEKGFGFESDVRDYMGKMVISHNPAEEDSPDAEQIFKELHNYQDKYCFAINIKADGLKDMLLEQFNKYEIRNYFTFDMSVPQMVEYIEKGIRVFTRQSEYEREPVFYNESAGVWIDGFENLDWITEELLAKHIQNGKYVCIVSPELHQRGYLEFWNKLRSMKLNFEYVMLCTDRPWEAEEYFNIGEGK